MTSWLTYYTYGKPAFSIASTNNQPDAYMENVVALILDKQGKPSMKIVAPKMTHYNERDTTHLTTPTFTIYRKSPNPWYIQSKYAKALNGTEQVHFSDHVVIHHAADITNPSTLIRTDTLLVKPKAQTAETSDKITMEQPHLTVNAVGLFADLNSGDIKLISNAQGTYVPQS
jgi:LPS export ABC transporter protein LptC